MAESQEAVFTVRTDAEWEAISSPIRVEMLVFMIVAGTCSIRELAALMNRPADGLYHHIRKLVKARIISEVGVRRVGTQKEMLYRTAAADISIDRNISNRRTRQRTIRLFRTIMKHALRTVEASLNSGETVLEGPRQNLRFNWLASWLDDAQLAKVHAHQDAISKILHEGLQRRDGQLVAVLTYMVPIQRTRGSEKGSP
jgi:hypothetical protein